MLANGKCMPRDSHFMNFKNGQNSQVSLPLIGLISYFHRWESVFDLSHKTVSSRTEIETHIFLRLMLFLFYHMDD